MRTRIVVLSVILLCGLASLATAQTPPPTSNRPGATLLLPYFEVDLSNPEGTTTLFSVNNSSATATLVHVTLWSDMGIPVFAFNVYLTGFDSQPMNMRDILNGTVPRTASDGQDPFDNNNPNDNAISNQGLFSQDINFASCNGHFPYSSVPANYVAYMQAALTGQASSFHGGLCVAKNHGTPTIARGYVTMDLVNHCYVGFPSDPIYQAPFAVMTTQNVIFGEYSYVNPSQDLAYGDSLVSITGDNLNPDTSTPGSYTFYGRFNNFLASDYREPLSSTFAARFVAPKDFKTPEKARRRSVLPPATELIVWRDPKHPSVNGFACGGAPAWYPLSQEDVVAFDEEENTESPTFTSQPFPAATQRVTLASTAFPLTTSSGWLYLNLNTSIVAPIGLTDPAAAQNWVTVLNRVQQGPNGGRYDVGYRATRFDNANTTSHITLIP
jgi:hypothetical protein